MLNVSKSDLTGGTLHFNGHFPGGPGLAVFYGTFSTNRLYHATEVGNVGLLVVMI